MQNQKIAYEIAKKMLKYSHRIQKTAVDMRNDRTPKSGDIDKYKRALESGVGRDVTVKYIASGRTVKQIEGVIEYASNSLFGVRVQTKDSSYILAFSYIDVFIGKIELKFSSATASTI